MYVQVWNCLSRGSSIINSDIVAVGGTFDLNNRSGYRE